MSIKSFAKKVTLTTLAALSLFGAALPASAATKVTVSSIGSDYDVWKFIAESEEAKKAGLEIEVKEIDGGLPLNKSVADGIVDANAFQSLGYLDAFNKESDNALVPIGTTYIEPMGIYSKKYKKIEEVKEGAVVALADNPANTTRALRLLESAGLIKLKADFDDGVGTPDDVIENPKKLEFKLIDDTTAVRVLDDVDLSIIGNTIALEGGLNVLKDAIYKEEINDSTKSRINVIAVKKGREKDENLLKLVELYHTPKVQEFIKEKFEGTKVEVKKDIKDVWKEAE
ncbi:MetQ/NlpA family ABC transporter substrate-binding protein [Abiotrophia sp.]|jgi:hypothetical protein|uniref:MetQ/NlpA family ABC transporter substrate-binding protein n=1 Tax=Abiotrophia sp. TaxID=76631 RepID=UPI0027BADCDE|nr:MetQ/NlpA family ABC transporter substrate-binding protein [Abiotrophia sp.]